MPVSRFCWGTPTHRSAKRGFRSAKRRSRVWDGRCLMSAGAIYKGPGHRALSKIGQSPRARREALPLATILCPVVQTSPAGLHCSGYCNGA
jgi:hypothetical protein